MFRRRNTSNKKFRRANQIAESILYPGEIPGPQLPQFTRSQNAKNRTYRRAGEIAESILNPPPPPPDLPQNNINPFSIQTGRTFGQAARVMPAFRPNPLINFPPGFGSRRRFETYIAPANGQSDQLYYLLKSNMGKTITVKYIDAVTGETEEHDYTVPNTLSGFYKFYDEQVMAPHHFQDYNQDTKSICFHNDGQFQVAVHRTQLVTQFGQQFYRDGTDGKCLIGPILESTKAAVENAIQSGQSTATIDRYRRYHNVALSFDVKYPNGIPHSALDELSRALSRHIVIWAPFLTEPLYDSSHVVTGKSRRGVHHFVNVSPNHVISSDYYGPGVPWIVDMMNVQAGVVNDNLEQRFVESPDEIRKIVDEFSSDENPVPYMLDKNNNYTSAVYDNVKYCTGELYSTAKKSFEDMNHIWRVDPKVTPSLSNWILASIHLNGVCKFKDSDYKMPYYNHINILDLKSSYANCHECPYYGGFPTNITDFRYTDRIHGHGFYKITNLKFDRVLPDIVRILRRTNAYRPDCIYPLPDLLFLEDIGVEFTVVAGAWCDAQQPTQDINFECMMQADPSLGSVKSYSRYVGASMCSSTSTKVHVRMSEEMAARIRAMTDFDVKGRDESLSEYTITAPKEQGKHAGWLISYINSYERISVLRQAINLPFDNIILLEKDGIVVQNNGYQIEFSYLYDGFVVKAMLDDYKYQLVKRQIENANIKSTTKYLKAVVSDIKQQLESCEPDNRHELLEKYSEASSQLDNLSSYISRPIEFEGSIPNVRPDETYEWPQPLTAFLGVAGGGKSEEIKNDVGLMRPLFLCPTHKNKQYVLTDYSQRDHEVVTRVETEALIRIGQDFKQQREFLSCGVVVIDEISFMHMESINIFREKFKYQKIILMGDPLGQLPAVDNRAPELKKKNPLTRCTVQRVKELTTLIHEQVVPCFIRNFNTMYRCKDCDTLKTILWNVREIYEQYKDGTEQGEIKAETTAVAYVREQFKELGRIKSIEDVKQNYTINDYVLVATRNLMDAYTTMLSRHLGEDCNKYRVESKLDAGGVKMFNGDILITLPDRIMLNGHEVDVDIEKIKHVLRPAHAFTAHSVQGETINENIYIDTDRIFECGAIYTALSRATSINSLNLIDSTPDTRVKRKAMGVPLDYVPEDTKGGGQKKSHKRQAVLPTTFSIEQKAQMYLGRDEIKDALGRAKPHQITTKKLREVLTKNKLVPEFVLHWPRGWDIDHIVPSNKGGPNSIYNYCILPKAMNRSYGDNLTNKLIWYGRDIRDKMRAGGIVFEWVEEVIPEFT